jgi:asparagine synthetase A
VNGLPRVTATEAILEMCPNLPRKQRETAVLQKYPAIFIIGIGWPLRDRYPHEMRAARNPQGNVRTEKHLRPRLNSTTLPPKLKKGSDLK